MDPAWLQLLALAPIAFCGALIYGITGFGAALVTIPLATFVVPLPFALSTFALVDLSSAIRLSLERPQNLVKGEWARIASTVVIGSILGTTALFHLPRAGALMGLGLFVIVYALYAISTPGRQRIVSQRWAYVAGVGSGFAGTLFGAGGPPHAIYLAHRPLGKEEFRATIAGCSIVSIGLRVVIYAVAGLLSSPRVWLAALLAVPAALLGVYVGAKVFHRIDRPTLMRVIAALLLVTGVSLVVRSLV